MEDEWLLSNKKILKLIYFYIQYLNTFIYIKIMENDFLYIFHAIYPEFIFYIIYFRLRIPFKLLLEIYMHVFP